MTSIDKLPDHVLVEIFSYLNVKTLFNLCLAYDRFSHLIKTSPHLMSRMSLRLTSINLNFCCVQNTLFSNHHVNLCIQKLPHNDDLKANQTHNETIKNQLATIKNVEYKNFFDRLTKFNESLRIFAGKVKSLKCTNSSFDRDVENEIDHVEFPELKELRIETSFYGFVKCFTKSKLTKLSLIHTSENPYMRTKLIDTFWESQVANLTELRIIDSPVDDEKILRVLACKKLRVFETNVKVLGVNPSILLELSKGFEWRRLKFKGAPFHPEVIRMIIGAHPDLISILFHLVMFEENQEVLDQIFTFHPTLQRLRISMNHGKFPKAPIPLQCLHTLEIEGVRYLSHINRIVELIKLSPNLKTLKIYWIGGHAFNSQSFLSIIRSAPNLEWLHLGTKTDTFEISNEMIQIIKSEAKNLKRLSVFTDDLQRTRTKMRELRDTRIKCTAFDRVYEDLNKPEQLIKIQTFPHPKERPQSTCEWRV